MDNVLSNSQAFVKMVGANVSGMEEQVTQVEGEVGTIPGTFKKFFRTMAVPGFLNVSSLYIHACLPYYSACFKIGNNIQLVINVYFLLFFYRNLLAQKGNHKNLKSFPVYLGQKITLNLSLSSKRCYRIDFMKYQSRPGFSNISSAACFQMQTPGIVNTNISRSLYLQLIQ